MTEYNYPKWEEVYTNELTLQALFEKLIDVVTENVVTGRSGGQYCDSVRKYHGCGMEGKYWEARK